MSHLTLQVNGFAASISFCLAIIINGFPAVLAANCSLLPVDGSMRSQIAQLVKGNRSTYLIRYKLHFPLQPSNPLVNNFRNVYKADSFSRVLSKHGQTLLSLAFNYGAISLMTLNYGTIDKPIDVYQSPVNCLTGLSEDDALNVVLYLLARDFDSTSSAPTIHDDERICLMYIVAIGNAAHFQPRCYRADTVTSATNPSEIGNKWIDSLYILMAVIKVLLLCFGPRLFIGYVAKLSQESAPYIVKLREPLVRTLFVAKTLSDFEKVRGDRILNLSKCRGYPKLKQTLENAPFGRPFQASISQYDILAPGNRLIKENEVPVTFWGAIAESVFSCKVKNVGPMQSCCYVDMFQNLSCVERRVPWIRFWTKVGVALLILFLPFLYYLRLILFYVFENEEIKERKDAAQKLQLTDSFDNSLIHYLRPVHWLFLTIYGVYFVGAVTLAYLSRSDDEGRLRNTIVGSFADLRKLSYIRVFQLIIENFLWPFKRFGILGCCVAIFYWPIAIPLTFIVYVFYSIPTIYLTVRMLFYSRRSFLEQVRTQSGVRKYQKSDKKDTILKLFQADVLFPITEDENQRPKLSEFSEEVDEFDKFRMDAPKDKPDEKRFVAPSLIKSIHISPSRLCQHMVASIACVLALYSLLIIVAESIGAVVEIVVFTLMGIIVNADVTVRYVALVVLIIVYTYDCFNNVQLRYYKLNKALFLELKGRVQGLDDVTSLPSALQENQAFKSQEQSAQGAHEKPDNIALHPSRHWYINDLVLFVDNEDTFRIPRRLFKDVCEISVSGVPGPVYKGVIEALKHFLKMLIFIIFIFIIVLSFGDIYELSNTTQTMAIASSGFLPIILRQFMEPKKPDIEINTLSFKSKLDEVVKNFWQLWPVHDFTFTPLPDPDTGTTEDDASATTEEATEAEPELEISVKGKEVRVGFKTADQRDNADDTQTDTATDTARTSTQSSGDANRKSLLGRLLSIVGVERSSLSAKQNVSATLYQVDLLIQLPERYEDLWVDGWSNVIQIDEPGKKHASNVAESMIEAAAAEKAKG